MHNLRGAHERSFGDMKELKKGRGKERSSRPIQYAVLPYREIKSEVQILLVTSRGTRRWIIPKGWPQRGTPPHRAAAREAFEEAGVVGGMTRFLNQAPRCGVRSVCFRCA